MGAIRIRERRRDRPTPPHERLRAVLRVVAGGHALMVAGSSSLFVVRPDGTGNTKIPIVGVPHPLFPDRIA